MQTTLEGVGERSRALIARDEKALSPSYKREYPLVVERAQGSELWDVDGRRYIDFIWCRGPQREPPPALKPPLRSGLRSSGTSA